jgi:hypothetical protein
MESGGDIHSRMDPSQDHISNITKLTENKEDKSFLWRPSLLSLPSELRNKIFEHCATNSIPPLARNMLDALAIIGRTKSTNTSRPGHRSICVHSAGVD